MVSHKVANATNDESEGCLFCDGKESMTSNNDHKQRSERDSRLRRRKNGASTETVRIRKSNAFQKNVWGLVSYKVPADAAGDESEGCYAMTPL